MASPTWEARLSKHAHDLDADGHDTHAPIMVLECNTNIVAGDPITWDTTYDVLGNDLHGTFPPGMGLSSPDGITFTATADIVLLMDVQIFLKAAPGHTGQIGLTTTNFYVGLTIPVAASGNPTTEFRRFIAVFVESGDTFVFDTIGTNPDVLATYADVQLTRIA